MPETEQLNSMFSDSGSISPTAATVFSDVLSGGGDGGTVGLWTGFDTSDHVTANIKLRKAMTGTA